MPAARGWRAARHTSSRLLRPRQTRRPRRLGGRRLAQTPACWWGRLPRLRWRLLPKPRPGSRRPGEGPQAAPRRGLRRGALPGLAAAAVGRPLLCRTCGRPAHPQRPSSGGRCHLPALRRPPRRSRQLLRLQRHRRSSRPRVTAVRCRRLARGQRAVAATTGDQGGRQPRPLPPRMPSCSACERSSGACAELYWQLAVQPALCCDHGGRDAPAAARGLGSGTRRGACRARDAEVARLRSELLKHARPATPPARRPSEPALAPLAAEQPAQRCGCTAAPASRRWPRTPCRCATWRAWRTPGSPRCACASSPGSWRRWPRACRPAALRAGPPLLRWSDARMAELSSMQLCSVPTAVARARGGRAVLPIWRVIKSPTVSQGRQLCARHCVCVSAVSWEVPCG